MKKLSCLIALASVGTTVSYANAQDYSAQIDALQNELLKIKQEMSKGGDNKAYFKKGKGLSVISADGKYSFQIKGRAMYDISHIGGFDDSSVSQDTDNKIDSFGAEFRRLRFSLKVGLGDGWSLAFQPDFAETIADDTGEGGKGVDVKDAFIKKKIKGFGSLMFGNAKSAGGYWENTSSNSILMMERPMYNEFANLAHRPGIHYDNGGAFFPKGVHVRALLIGYGNEGSWRFEQEDGDGGEVSWNHSIATHYTGKGLFDQIIGGKDTWLLGASWQLERPINDNARGVSFRQNGVHTLGEKIVDSTISNISSYHYGGPQFQYSNGPFYFATEYYWITGERRDGYETYDDYSAEGGSIYSQYFFNGNATVKINSKKGKIGGVKCKSTYGCTAVKFMLESIDARDSELNGANGTHGKAIHVGVNHYFNSNVRLMIDATRGVYLGGHDDFYGGRSDAVQATSRHTMTSIQARMHIKF